MWFKSLFLVLLVACGPKRPVEPLVEAWTSPIIPRHFVVRSLWLDGEAVVRREEIDAFQQCLLSSSNFADFWGGEVTFEVGGSWVVPVPAEPIAPGESASIWLTPMIRDLPPVADATPIYVVYAHAREMERAACGQCGYLSVADQPVGVAVVRTAPPCWPAQGLVRNLTQFTQHELSCAVELAMGEDHCAADGRCEGRGQCPDRCDTFTGLYCEGAPESSYTGCDGNPVRGWVVQKLSHEGQGTDECPDCRTCDFTTISDPPTGP